MDLKPDEEALRVLFVAPECAPLAKTGGLGDVCAALPVALRHAGVDVRVLLPGYAGVMEAVAGAHEIACLSYFRPPVECRLLETRLAPDVPLLILDSAPLYRRPGGPYQNSAGMDWPDNALRFGALSRAASLLGEASSPLSWRPQIIHCHDWPAGLACAYLHYARARQAASVMTVHNMAFQGNFEPHLLARLELPPESYALDGLEFHGQLSFLKAGLYYADAITTVSPRYAEEIQTAAYGAGMEGLLRHRRAALTGILNGIDGTAWNPEKDPHLPVHYSAETLERKRLLKQALRQRLQLAERPDEVPLLGVVGRLTHQKGADILASALPDLVRLPAQLAILGTGEPQHESALRALAARQPGDVSVTIGFDEALAHLIEAGADMFLMPSRFEPCGLNQMYSQRYGTPPIAHATGGLVDTIVDCNGESLAAGTATGFLFQPAAPRALLDAVRRAVALYREPEKWRAVQRNGMARDFSWAASARRYADLYRRVARERGFAR